MSSLRQRLTDRSWEQDWPVPAAPVAPPADWLAALALAPWEHGESKFKDLAERQFHQMVALLQGQDHPSLPQAIVHKHLDALEAWNAAVTWQATWPPTVEGLGRAIAASHEKQATKPEMMLGLALVLHAYPDLAWTSIQAMPKHARKALPEAWFATSVEPKPEPAASTPVEPAASPAVVEPVQAIPSVSSAEAKQAAVTPPPELPSSPPAPHPWLARVLDELAHSQAPQSIQRQSLTQAIKVQQHASSSAAWFEEEMYPALVALSPEHNRQFISLNPEVTFVIQNPQAWVRSPGFWGGFKAMDPDNRARLLTQILPRLVNTSPWTDGQRSLVLRNLISITRTDRHPAVFEQRMALWQGWGGRLDMPFIRDTSSPEPQGFGGVQRKLTTLEWLAQEEGAPMWNEWAKARLIEDRGFVPGGVAVPPPAPRPRHRGP